MSWKDKFINVFLGTPQETEQVFSKQYNLIIGGSRHLNPPIEFIDDIARGMFPQVDDPDYEIVVIHGGARGVDDAGARWASEHMFKQREFSANWRTHGKAAGPIRNRKMAEAGDGLLLIWDGQSKGSASMLKEAKKLGLTIASCGVCHERTFEKVSQQDTPIYRKIRDNMQDLIGKQINDEIVDEVTEKIRTELADYAGFDSPELLHDDAVVVEEGEDNTLGVKLKLPMHPAIPYFDLYGEDFFEDPEE